MDPACVPRAQGRRSCSHGCCRPCRLSVRPRSVVGRRHPRGSTRALCLPGRHHGLDAAWSMVTFHSNIDNENPCALATLRLSRSNGGYRLHGHCWSGSGTPAVADARGEEQKGEGVAAGSLAAREQGTSGSTSYGAGGNNRSGTRDSNGVEMGPDAMSALALPCTPRYR